MRISNPTEKRPKHQSLNHAGPTAKLYSAPEVAHSFGAELIVIAAKPPISEVRSGLSTRVGNFQQLLSKILTGKQSLQRIGNVVKPFLQVYLVFQIA